MGEEAGGVDGRPVNLPNLDLVTNLGTDIVPDTIERGVKDSTERLDRDMGVSANGLGEECCEEIRMVNEFRVVAVPGDAVIVGSPLVSVGGVLETTMASPARVRAERLGDPADTSVRVGDAGALRC